MRIGSDPEFFVRAANGKILPAFKFLSAAGTTGVTQPYWDGFQAEFTTHPHQKATGLLGDLQRGIQELAGKLPEGAQIVADSVAELSGEELQNTSAEHVALGCSPSRNIYGLFGRGVQDGRKLGIRFAGGHLHFELRGNPARFVENLDATLGIVMCSLAAGYDDPRRRLYYGLAGEYRLPSHGLEYRTLSNFWATHPALASLAVDLARTFLRMPRAILASQREIVEILNNTDVAGARRVLRENSGIFLAVLERLYGRGAYATWRALLDGPESVRIDPRQVERNWTRLVCWGVHVNAN